MAKKEPKAAVSERFRLRLIAHQPGLAQGRNSLPQYYQVESRALGGLLRACEPRSKGRQKSMEQEVTVLRRDQERLQRQLARQQALLRLEPSALPPL